MTVIEVIADNAILYTCRETGEVMRVVYLTDEQYGMYDYITGFDPLHPVLMFAQEWDGVSICKLTREVAA